MSYIYSFFKIAAITVLIGLIGKHVVNMDTHRFGGRRSAPFSDSHSAPPNSASVQDERAKYGWYAGLGLGFILGLLWVVSSSPKSTSKY